MQEIGDIPRLDDALNGLTWTIARDPSVFDQISGINGIFRVAQSTPIKENGNFFRFTIIFKEVSDELIELLYLEKVPCETI
jgi:hypothetical protein